MAVFVNYGYIDPSFSYYYHQMNGTPATYVWENKSLKTNIKRIASYNEKYAGGNPPIYYIYPQVTIEEYEKRVSTIISICDSLYSLPETVIKQMKCDFFPFGRFICTVHYTAFARCTLELPKKIAHILIPYYGASSNYCGAYNIASAHHRCMEDKKKWEKHIAKTQYKTGPKKGLIEIEWQELGENPRQIVCNRSDYIWEVKKKFDGTKDWRNIICFISAIPALNSKKISDYFDNEKVEPAAILYVKRDSSVPKDKDQASDESDDDEIMFLEN